MGYCGKLLQFLSVQVLLFLHDNMLPFVSGLHCSQKIVTCMKCSQIVQLFQLKMLTTTFPAICFICKDCCETVSGLWSFSEKMSVCQGEMITAIHNPATPSVYIWHMSMILKDEFTVFYIHMLQQQGTRMTKIEKYK